MGSGYVIEHCVSTLSDYRQQQAFMFYMADGVKLIGETVANYYGGKYMTMRLSELLEPPKPELTGDEIALDVIRRLGLITE